MPTSGDIRVGELEVRPQERVVLVDGHDVPLTSREFEIVMMMAEHPGWVFSADQLAGDPEEGDHSPESVSVLVSRVRQKLAAVGAHDVVDTVRGFGYRLSTAGSSVSRDESDPAHAARTELREALWQIQETVIEVEHSGSYEQQRSTAELLEQLRRAIYASLAE